MSMLVLTRKPGEGVVLGGNVTLIVVGVKGGRVRLAIDAPKQIHILRGELACGPHPPVPNQEPPDPDPEGAVRLTK
jgi:carbon storage regulator CsrA